MEIFQKYNGRREWNKIFLARQFWKNLLTGVGRLLGPKEYLGLFMEKELKCQHLATLLPTVKLIKTPWGRIDFKYSRGKLIFDTSMRLTCT